MAVENESCYQCGEELDDGQCCNSFCSGCDWYDPPCAGCGVQKGWDRENTQMCKTLTCSLSPWYDPFIDPLPDDDEDDSEYKRAYQDRLWRCVDRLIWLNPGITFKEIRSTMRYRMGAFMGDAKRALSMSMQYRIDQQMIVRYKHGWRFAKPPHRDHWQDGEILEIAGVEIDGYQLYEMMSK